MVWTTSEPRAWVRVAAGFGAAAAIVLWAGSASAQVGTSAAPAFAGSASAVGVRLTLEVPGAPGTNVPVDGGGPTAQVAVDSFGSSTAYAAFPDPGEFFVSLPGLMTGLIGGGAFGLPPIEIPSLPEYPFYVRSDASGDPEQSIGAGPYEITAVSEQGGSRATGVGGLQTDLAGSAALVTSTASVESNSDGTVVSEARVQVQGLSIGPLVLGEVESVSTQQMGPDGAVTDSTELHILGARVGGVGIEIGTDGLVVLGSDVPLAGGDVLSDLLAGADITIEVLAAQQSPDQVTGAALKITYPFAMPFPVPGLGQFHGTATMIIGSTWSSLEGGVTRPPTAANPSTPADSAALPSTGGTSTGGTSTGSSGIGTATPSASPAPGPTATGSAPNPTAEIARQMDITSLYLVLTVAAIVLSAASHTIRRFGGNL